MRAILREELSNIIREVEGLSISMDEEMEKKGFVSTTHESWRRGYTDGMRAATNLIVDKILLRELFVEVEVK